MTSTVTVSLEPHLARSLGHIVTILPPELCGALTSELDLKEIHYDILARISRWARTDAGQARLRAAQLNPRDYDNIVSLLAGTRTAPSSKPPPNVPSLSESVEGRVRTELNDKKALVAVLNGLLTIGCAGGAMWWAADRSGMRDEWKALLALMVATIVGVSEAALFIIWQSRSSHPDRRRHRQKLSSSSMAIPSNKKSDDNGEPSKPTLSTHDTPRNVESANARLRHRIAHDASESETR